MCRPHTACVREYNRVRRVGVFSILRPGGHENYFRRLVSCSNGEDRRLSGLAVLRQETTSADHGYDVGLVINLRVDALDRIWRLMEHSVARKSGRLI